MRNKLLMKDKQNMYKSFKQPSMLYIHSHITYIHDNWTNGHRAAQCYNSTKYRFFRVWDIVTKYKKVHLTNLCWPLLTAMSWCLIPTTSQLWAYELWEIIRCVESEKMKFDHSNSVFKKIEINNSVYLCVHKQGL